MEHEFSGKNKLHQKQLQFALRCKTAQPKQSIFCSLWTTLQLTSSSQHLVLGSSHSNCLAMGKARLKAGAARERKWVGKRDAHNASKIPRVCIVGDWGKLSEVNEADWMLAINQSFRSFRKTFLTWSSSFPLMNAHSFNLQDDDVGEYCSIEEILRVCYRCRARTRGIVWACCRTNRKWISLK